MSPLQGFLFGLLGVGAGLYGSIIGAGGGFIVMPVLLLLFPAKTPAFLTSVSLAVAGLNGLSSTASHAQHRRLDYTTGLLVSGSIVPGALLGAWLTRYLSRGPFDVAFGLLVIGLALYIVLRPPLTTSGVQGRGNVTRRYVDARGQVHVYSFSRERAMAISFVAGVVAALMGVGGGIIMVPLFVGMLRFPPAIATSTSLFALIFMTGSATVLHLAVGDLTVESWQLVLAIGVGVVVGAQGGTRLARRLPGRRVMQLLALALVVVGIRLVVQGLVG